MADNQSGTLRFSVEETVWFEKGQEVDEMVSMSLEPDIAIVEHNQHVSIKGALLLSGEYFPQPENEAEAAERYDPDRALRLVDRVSSTGEGTSILEHRFPIDITVPKTRVEKLHDVYVTIDTFDYELPKDGCLQLSADLSISGISTGLNAQQSASDRVDEKAQQENNFDEGESNGNGNNAKEEQKAAPELEPVNMRIEQTIQANDPVVTNLTTADHDASTDDGEKDDKQEAQYESASLQPLTRQEDHVSEDVENSENVITFETEARKRAEQQADQEEQVMHIGMKSRPEEELDQSYWARSHTELDHKEADQLNDAELEDSTDKPERAKRDENALYLTKFLANEEEDFARMKMYITQEGDSLESIAERYRLLSTHLIKVNHLEEEEVHTGQILYIPVTEE